MTSADKDRAHLRRKFLMVASLLVFAAVVVLSGLYILIFENPRVLVYHSFYSDVIYLSGRGHGYFEGQYTSMIVNVQPAGRDKASVRTMDTSRLEVVIDGRRYKLSDLTLENIVLHGATKLDISHGPDYDTWLLVGTPGVCGAAIYVRQGKVISIDFSRRDDGTTEPCNGIAIIYNGQAPITLPILHSQMIEYFGRPSRAEKFLHVGP